MKNLKERSYLLEHKPFLGPAVAAEEWELNAGDVVTFSYDGKDRTVFVLNPNEDKLHGITLEKVSRRDLLNKVVKFWDNDNPESFYHAHIRNLVERTDAYRTYNFDKIVNLKRMYYIRSFNKTRMTIETVGTLEFMEDTFKDLL